MKKQNLKLALTNINVTFMSQIQNKEKKKH